MTLKISNLSKKYHTADGIKTVLDGLYLNIEPGELFALMGANGSGKTTLLKIISTLILPSSGEVIAGGVNIAESPSPAKAGIGLVSGVDGGFYQMLSAEENIRFFAKLYGAESKDIFQRISGVFERLGLSEYKKTKFSHLSSGARQKLSFARAFIRSPKVVLVDEVSRSLDEASSEKISLFLSEYVKETNACCIAVTHDKQWAQKYSRRAGKLINGRIEAL